MRNLILRRLLASIPLLFLVALAAFALLQLAPGDFWAELQLNPQIAPETRAALRVQYGLDQPWYVQFAHWLAQVARGNLGYSFAYNQPVTQLIGARLFNTVTLALAALLLALLIAVPSGVLACDRRFRAIARALSALATVIISLPSLVLALLAVLLAARTGWFPLGGASGLDAETLTPLGKLTDYLWHLLLPALVLAARQVPGYFRQVRASVHETLTQDFILTARAKGLPERRILFKHALRNALNPVVSMFGNSLSSLLSGAFVVEAVLSWPGLGRLAVEALLSRDLFVLLGCLLYAALLLALGNLLADVLLLTLDPRIRLGIRRAEVH